MSTTTDEGPAWSAAAGAVAGAGHRERGRPCQDAAGVSSEHRVYAIVCDGKGSSSLSQHGARDAADAIASVLATLEPSLCAMLDAQDVRPADLEAGWRLIAQLIVMQLLVRQRTLVVQHGGVMSEYEYTLALAVAGRTHIGIVQVGDCVVVCRRNGVLGIVSEPDRGRYINETDFVGPRLDERLDLRLATIPSAGTDGVVLMSDGMACHLCGRASAVPALGVAQLLDWRRAGRLGDKALAAILSASRWDASYGDDRAVALLVRSADATCEREPEALR
jgi:hypothetical protein